MKRHCGFNRHKCYHTHRPSLSLKLFYLLPLQVGQVSGYLCSELLLDAGNIAQATSCSLSPYISSNIAGIDFLCKLNCTGCSPGILRCVLAAYFACIIGASSNHLKTVSLGKNSIIPLIFGNQTKNTNNFSPCKENFASV